MRRWTITGILLLCLVVLAGVTACNPFGGDEEKIQQLVEVVRGDLTISVTGSGNIEASREAWLTFGSSGRVDKLYAEEGDEVSKGEVLASLDTGTLELARTQAQVALTQTQVALTQAQVALTQAQVARQTAEYNLKNTLDTEDARELALFKAQIDTKTAKYNLEQTRDLYTWSDIKTAKADVDDAERYLENLLERVGKYLPKDEDGNYPNILEYVFGEDYPKPPGYEALQEELVHAQSRLNTAEDRLDAMLSGSDPEEVAIKKLQLEAAEMAVAQAQKNLDELAEEVVIKELQIELARQSLEQVWQSLELAQQSVKLSQQSLEETQKQLDEANITAPFDGVVATVYVKEGDLIPTPTVAPKTVVYLIDPTSMELEVEVDEIDIPEVRLNQEVIIDIDALPDIEFTGRVTTILPVPITEGGVVLYNVKINFDVPEGSNLKVGMSASADIIINKRSNILLVPGRAIKQDSEGNPMVEVIVNGDIEERRVVEGVSDGFDTEIISGLSEGEVVVVGKRAK